MKRFLAGLCLAAILAGAGQAANLTPDELTQATTANNTDLLLVYPSGGPLKSVQWSVVKGLMQSALGSVYLQTGNNLSDVASPSSARGNLGLGTAATVNTGTSGAVAPLLSGANTWGATQTLAAGTTTAAPLTFQAGSLLTTPLAGALEWDGTSLYATQSAGPTRQTLVYSSDTRFSALTQNSQSAAYPLVLSDAGKELYHPSTDTLARTFTIPANASVAFPVVSKIEIVNDCSAGALTIAITTDTLEWFPAGTTGARTLQPCGMATLTKVGATRWVITGTGLS